MLFGIPEVAKGLLAAQRRAMGLPELAELWEEAPECIVQVVGVVYVLIGNWLMKL